MFILKNQGKPNGKRESTAIQVGDRICTQILDPGTGERRVPLFTVSVVRGSSSLLWADGDSKRTFEFPSQRTFVDTLAEITGLKAEIVEVTPSKMLFELVEQSATKPTKAVRA